MLHTSREMLADFDKAFTKMADSFMNRWGDYIGDAEDVESIIQNSFNNWVDNSGWFED